MSIELTLAGGTTDVAGWTGWDGRMTPATNLLPMRRLAHLGVGAAADITAAHAPLPAQIEGAFLPRPRPQRYTRLGARRWRYEGLFRGFVAEQETGEAGMVPDDPDTFGRLP